MILALALADVRAAGWFGKVVKGKRQGTSNVGSVTGGDGGRRDATNVVTDYVHVRGESRSHDSKFFKEITKAYKMAFEKAAKRVKNSDANGPREVQGRDRLLSVPHEESLPVVSARRGGVRHRGTPSIRAANGGLDANWMVRHRVPTVTFGAGQNDVHTIDDGSISTSTTEPVRSPYTSRRCAEPHDARCHRRMARVSDSNFKQRISKDEFQNAR